MGNDDNGWMGGDIVSTARDFYRLLMFFGLLALRRGASFEREGISLGLGVGGGLGFYHPTRGYVIFGA